MGRLTLFLALIMLASPAMAHRLKVFAAPQGGAISGYAFFVGGGRPEGARFVVQDAAGQRVYEGRTGPKGDFRWVPDAPGAYILTVDTGDGHVASVAVGRDAPRGQAAGASLVALSPAGRAEEIGEIVAEAVQKEIRPLQERIEALDARLRFTDILSGIFLIVGLAGGALWAVGRRR